MAGCTRCSRRSLTATACSAASARPGFLISAVHLLAENPNPSREEIRAGLSGNICRCTGYAGIVNAVRQAAARG